MNSRGLWFLLTGLIVCGVACGRLAARGGETAGDSLVQDVEWQPLAAQLKRVSEAMELAGSPFDAKTEAALRLVLAQTNSDAAIKQAQEILDARCLVEININPESRVKVRRGKAPAELMAGGWRALLVKVDNEAGVTAPLKAESPNAEKLAGSPASEVASRWLELRMFEGQPLPPALSGLRLDYRILELYSSAIGKREAKISFNVGQGTQDLGFRNEVDILFNCTPARKITLRVRDEKGQPTTAAFVFRDQQGRIYPPQNKRLAPDMPFQAQIYRADGETLELPDGTYTVQFSRGPESIAEQRTFTVADGAQTLEFRVKRWIDPSQFGWWSGDHHIHAAGCAHYEQPTQGVLPQDMMRHCLGEDLKVGCNLTWGPCFDHQKQFFCGLPDKIEEYPYLLHYDIEVSGFGSHQSGHLCLLRLRQEIYPGGDSDKHWPTLGLNTLRWAKQQGAVAGPAHSGWGLAVAGEQLPNYEVPKYDGIGADEYIVDVTHELPGPDGKPAPAVDFLSLGDTPYVWELNMWYQTLNVGFRTRASGETDFPCISAQRVGLGRSYVKLEGKLDYSSWCEGIRAGRCYVSDGHSHLMDFKINEAAVGERGSELKLARPGTVTISARAAAWLNERADSEIKNLQYTKNPYWQIERARLGASREVPVEVIVDGIPVARQNLTADGVIRDLKFDIRIERRSWVALRILPSSHTNPICVLVGGKPVSPSRRSAQWCLKGVDQCWSQKQRFIRPDEMADAKKAYEHAREVYRKLVERAELE